MPKNSFKLFRYQICKERILHAEKIRARQEQEKMKALTSTSIRSMEEFCEKFDHAQMVGIVSESVTCCACVCMVYGYVCVRVCMSVIHCLHFACKTDDMQCLAVHI